MQIFKSRIGGDLVKSLLALCAVSGLFMHSGAGASATEGTRPFTVKDSIERSKIEGFGPSALQSSPDGKQLAFVTTKGDLKSGANRSTIWIITKAQQAKPSAVAVIERSSTTNTAPISAWRWVDSGRAIAFLSPDESGFVQVFRTELHSKQTKQITKVAADVNTFDISGDVCTFFATEKEYPQFPSPGGYLKDESLLRLLIRGEANLPGSAYVQRGQEAARRVTKPVVSYFRANTKFSISPNGRMAVATLPATTPPDTLVKAWAAAAPAGARLVDDYPSLGLQLYAIDLERASITPLVNAPTGVVLGDRNSSQIVWSPNSDSVVVTDTLLAPADLPAGQQWPVTQQVVEVKFGAGKSLRVLPADDGRQANERTREMKWASPNEFSIYSVTGGGGGEGSAGAEVRGRQWRATYSRTGDGWARSSREEVAFSARPRLDDVEFFAEESANMPPRVVGQRVGTQEQAFLLDVNPQLARLELLPINPVSWADKEGYKWSGGLILPKASGGNPGRVPLVIAMKFFNPNVFSPDGPYTTAFASQALAAKGIAVLELNAFAAMGTKMEGPMQMRGIESAIDHLVAQQNVDPDRIGLIGFSRTCYHVTYALTHSSRRFAAATVADGLSGGYVQYHAYSLNHFPGNGVKPLYDALNDGPPWGDTLQNWVKNSPDMNAGKISTPLRIEMLGKSSVLQEWELYSSLKLQGKPVDVLYLPEATHVLVKPAERFLSQQGNVNWFSYWLLGERQGNADSDADYNRWGASMGSH